MTTNLGSTKTRAVRFEAPARAKSPSLARRAGGGIVVLVFCLTGATPAGEFTSPDDIWRGYDATALSLDTKVIRSWEEDGIALDKLTFTGELAGDVKVRVFAIQGAPKSRQKLPGILHIHGGGQTANLQWVKFWAAHGYVCVTFDFCGPWADRKEFTDWGPLTQANMAKAGAGWPTGTDSKTSSWYHWALVSRRALTLLAKHPKVDPNRLGIFGISVGGTLCWVVAGSDSRVKTAVPIYGCGYNVDRRRTPELIPEAALYQRTLSPEAHAPSITCPILHLNATNDFHGLMDNSYDILHSMKGPTRVAFTPRYNHHIAPEQATDLERWMDWHLKDKEALPNGPRLQLVLTGEGIPQAHVLPDDPKQMVEVNVYYALGNRIPQARFWRRVSAVRNDVCWEATLPVMDPWDTLHAFANVIYKSGVCLSTDLARVIPGQLGKARPTLAGRAIFDDCREGPENWVYVGAYTDPVIRKRFLLRCEFRQGGSAFQVNPELFGNTIKFAIGSHIIGDPQYQGRDGMLLAFDCKGGFDDNGLSISLIERDWSAQSRTYTATVPRAELDTDWRSLRLPLSRFTDKDGRHLARWKDAEKIEIRGLTSRKEPPRFAFFRWVDEKPEPKK